MQLYFWTKRINNKSAEVTLCKWDAAADHCLSLPAMGRYRRLFEEEPVEGQYLRCTINTLLIDLAKPKKGTLGDGDDSWDEGAGECEGQNESECEGQNVGKDEDIVHVERENVDLVLPQAIPELAPGVSARALAADDDVVGQD